MNNILVIGTGELGHAILTSFYTHARFNQQTHSLTTTVRPSTLSNASPSRTAQLDKYKSQNIDVLPLDIETDSLQTLTSHFIPFTTIIHAGGMTLSQGTQSKVTQAVLDSASSPLHPTNPAAKKLYIPWQFGLDYDVIGPEAGNGLFAEQCSIRATLRAQDNVDWVIVSNGIFTSFMFETLWGVVPNPPTLHPDSNEITVRALGSWDDRIVATTAEGIAACTAELVLVDTGIRGRPVFIAGDYVTYGEVAEIVGRVSGRRVKRELWDTEFLTRRMEGDDPQIKLRKYHVVFSQGVGTSWDMEETYNRQNGIKLEGIEEWLRRNWDI